ncbi:MAG: hypothetical protein NT020_07725, partial [Chloroflexales bacterium]|nr:hypothetical protein [Chloroflexales bacterium]
RFRDDIECTTRRSAACDKSAPTQMFALAISTGFIYPHVVALELTIRLLKKLKSYNTIEKRSA